MSKLPDIITKVIPADMIPTIEDCLSRFNIFLLVRNAGDAMLTIMHNSIKPNITP